jgi:transposase
MLTLSANARIFLCKDPISMRKSFEGLSAAVEQLFPGELFSGACFIFLNRSRNHMKVLFWDRDGFAIWYKRLEKGSFGRNIQNHMLDRREFVMLLEGIEPKKIRSKFSLKTA